jgi:hypothetical protein
MLLPHGTILKASIDLREANTGKYLLDSYGQADVPVYQSLHK